MKVHTPNKPDASRRTSSININPHRTSMGSGLPVARPHSRIAIARATTTQPTYDFITGAESASRPPSRGEPFRQSARRSTSGQREATKEPDVDWDTRRRELEDLRTEVKTLRYTIDNGKQEEELTKLRHESELRDARRKAEEDFKQKQNSEAEKSKALRQYEALVNEMADVREAASNDKVALEKRFRKFEESKRLLEEEIDDVKAEKGERIRMTERKVIDLETRNTTLQQTVEELHQDSDRREALLQVTQTQLADRNATIGSLETEVLRLKAQNGDAETLDVIKRELGEQVAHIKKLESCNRKQGAELDHLKKVHISVDVVEEEKRTLQNRLAGMEELRNELGEARIQRQRLEDERRAWTAYLSSQGSADDEVEFDSPESLARAFIEDRLQRAVIVERLGGVEAELSGKDAIIEMLEKEKSTLSSEIDELKSSRAGPGDSKVKLRLERQKNLACKEVELLRAQLKVVEEDDEGFPENFEEMSKERQHQVDDLLNQYKKEVETLESELKSRDSSAPVEIARTKRPREDFEDSERIGQLSRKNRRLQNDLNTLQASYKFAQTELAVTQDKLAAVGRQVNTRVLSLRLNPTSDYEAIKQSTLTALRKENTDLLSQLHNGPGEINSVPLSTLTTAQQALRDLEAALATEKKMALRRGKVFSEKAIEFREVVISLLGWSVVFLKNGKTKISSDMYPARGDNENSIEFDGERGTMKVSGGPRSAFAERIKEQSKFWVGERGNVPCFLAALTLEFWEEANRDRTIHMG
ncbi:spindle assembly checkpoint component Mad1 [Calycina marina]|uniref:Spindle assembly checkpoint component MAD1 n=1 Tax=Calycina marina TaxID=1763456 RepID=A0A9P8CIA8_9HELO|nr:spindle assembly checkpoint component Mad1 [Calycina marina]